MNDSIGMAVALVCIALLIGAVAALLGGWLARKSGANTARCAIQAAGAFAIAAGMMLAVFTFLGLSL